VVVGDELDHNGYDGAISLASHHTKYVGNHVHDNGKFGLTIEDAPAAQATISFNRVTGNSGPGVLVRDSDQATITANSISDNCAGIFALSTYAPATGVAIRLNVVTANNRFCPANDDGYPRSPASGSGSAAHPTLDCPRTSSPATRRRAERPAERQRGRARSGVIAQASSVIPQQVVIRLGRMTTFASVLDEDHRRAQDLVVVRPHRVPIRTRDGGAQDVPDSDVVGTLALCTSTSPDSQCLPTMRTDFGRPGSSRGQNAS
jgi:parallel beta-helix repeat protein